MNPIALLVVIVAVAVIIAGLGVYLREHAGDPEFDLTIPATHFMPYSVCPKCDHEGLHWITVPDLDRVKRTIDRLHRAVDDYNDRCAYALRRHWDTPVMPPMDAGDRVAYEIAKGADIIRTCRDCEHEWTQEVGPLLKLAA